MNNIRAKKIANSLFALFVIASLVTPSWRYGPFSWWPLGGRHLHVAGGPVNIGLLNFLPALTILIWVVRVRHTRSWRWGPGQITIPLALYSLWSFLRLAGAPPRYVFVYGGNLIVLWFVYLFVINQKPRLSFILGFVLLIQSVVGISQFMLQRDMGLSLLGELPLNPQFSGVSVIEARGRHWLRAYGLTAHPNLYGALLAVCMALIFFHPDARWQSRRWGIGILAGIGLVAIYFSFSRAAWLGLAMSMVASLFIRSRQDWRLQRRSWAWLVLLLILLSLILTIYGDLALNRFTNLQNPLEARSISERLSDARLAIQIFLQHPLLGVGYGRYLDFAATMNTDAARVHNVLLLTAAELGMPGAIAVTWLMVAPLLAFYHLYRRGFRDTVASGLAPWLLAAVINQFDTTLWISGNWQTALLFALIAGQVSQFLKTPMSLQPQASAAEAVDRSE